MAVRAGSGGGGARLELGARVGGGEVLEAAARTAEFFSLFFGETKP